MATKNLNNLHECVDVVSQLYDDHMSAKPGSFTYLCHESFPMGIWFRGEENRPDSVLTPSVFRSDGGKHQYDETQLFAYGRTRFPIEYHAAVGDYGLFPSLVHMQHYGVPTRLLDWTESLAAAVFFAAQEIDSPYDGLLHVLNARKLNSVSGFTPSPINLHDEESYGTVFRCLFCTSNTEQEWHEKAGAFAKRVDFHWDHKDMPPIIKDEKSTYMKTGVPQTAMTFLTQPVAVIPGLVHARLKSQQGVFTLHGGKVGGTLPPETSLTDLSGKVAPSEQFLQSYLIPRTAKSRIKRELLALGVRAGTIYPEPDKQAEHLKEMFRR
jgi:hypothetical protein